MYCSQTRVAIPNGQRAARLVRPVGLVVLRRRSAGDTLAHDLSHAAPPGPGTHRVPDDTPARHLQGSVRYTEREEWRDELPSLWTGGPAWERSVSTVRSAACLAVRVRLACRERQPSRVATSVAIAGSPAAALGSEQRIWSGAGVWLPRRRVFGSARRWRACGECGGGWLWRPSSEYARVGVWCPSTAISTWGPLD